MILNKYEIEGTDVFKMFLLSNSQVKRILKDYNFYNIRFFKINFSSSYKVCLEYPKANIYWALDFKRDLLELVSQKYPTYLKETTEVLENLIKIIKLEYLDNLKVDKICQKDVVDMMLKYKLRDYQAWDALKLKNILEINNTNKGTSAMVLSAPRTGKTRTTLASFSESSPSWASTLVVVCPKSAVGGWIKECNELTNMNAEAYVIKSVKDIKNLNSKSARCIHIITFELFRMLNNSQNRQIFRMDIDDSKWLIVDEAHRLRNFSSNQSRALFNTKSYYQTTLGIPFNSILLTGTPCIRVTTDIYGLLSFCNNSKIHFQPTITGFNEFKEYFYNCMDTNFGKECLSFKRKDEINYLVKSLCVQTKKRDLAFFKNYKIKYKKVELDMDDLQKEIYKDVDELMEYENIDCKTALVQTLRLQQICVDPNVLVDKYQQYSPKFKWIYKFLKTYPDMQVLIVLKRISGFDNLRKLLNLANITNATIEGKTSLNKRIEIQKEFQDGKIQALLIQQDAGKESLTLSNAKAIIFLERDWCPGFNEQMEERMTPVSSVPITKYVIDLVMRNTKEELLYDILVQRKEAVDDVNVLYKKEVK